jgi:hypothetical protein
MLESKCYCCSKAGHNSPTCHLKDKIPKDDWSINKAKAQGQNTKQSHLNTNKLMEKICHHHTTIVHPHTKAGVLHTPNSTKPKK